MYFLPYVLQYADILVLFVQVMRRLSLRFLPPSLQWRSVEEWAEWNCVCGARRSEKLHSKQFNGNVFSLKKLCLRMQRNCIYCLLSAVFIATISLLKSNSNNLNYLHDCTVPQKVCAIDKQWQNRLLLLFHIEVWGTHVLILTTVLLVYCYTEHPPYWF